MQHDGDGRFDPLGCALVIASALLYSTLGIFGKFAYQEGLSVPSLLSTRFTIAAVLLGAFVALSPRMRRGLRALSSRRLAAVFLWGAFGFGGQSALFFTTLSHISAGLSVLLLYTCPAFLAIIVWLRTGRRPAAARLAAIALALAGTWLCAGPIDGVVSPQGVALGVATGLCFAVFLLGLHRVNAGVPAVLSAALIAAGAACAFDAWVVIRGDYILPPTRLAWAAVLGMVICATIAGFVLLVVGMRRVGPQVTSVLSTFEPVGALLLAALLLGERLRGTQWFGAALIIGAAFTLAAPPRVALTPPGGEDRIGTYQPDTD
ncbi:MAG TPA: DMT family transporter [Candidatus Polarisedimenticolia bacterium]|nr:DMT family transporter [Candidatus Polarisedimenticolia bacterium]